MTADLLRARLDDLATELRVRDRPERRAWHMLKPTRNGWTALLYDDGAVETWRDVLRRYPRDLSAVHHLAIMHHARAIDLEQSAHPSESDPDWRLALDYWNRLFKATEFWSALSERVDATPDPVPRVREDLAERLLRMHFDIALDEQSPHHRSRFHIQLALGSGFPPELVERVRTQAYERAVDGLNPAVWRPGSAEPEVLWPAVDTVIRYLERDDDCVAALKDLLRLLSRLQVAWIQQVNAVTDRGGSRLALDEFLVGARRYDGYISRLESQLLSGAEPDRLTLSDLALWLSRAGQACQVADAYEESAGYYRRAQRAARAGGDPREGEYSDERLTSAVLAARECALSDGKRARRLLGDISEIRRAPGMALLIRAQAWLLLGELGKADRDAKAAPGSPQGHGHAVAQEELRAACRELRDQIRLARLSQKIKPLLEKAEHAAAGHQWREAITALDDALALHGEHVRALLLRAECYLSLLETAAAKRDLDRADRLSRAANNPQATEVVRQIMARLTALDKTVTEYGGPDAFRLQQQSVKAYNNKRYDDAIDRLRQARRLARPGGTAKLAKELAQCLNTAAVQLAEQIMRGGPVATATQKTLADRAVSMLTEAAALDPAPAITQNLAQVTMLRQQMGYW